MPDQPHLVLLNGSIRGQTGNTGWLIDEAALRLDPRATVETVHLADPLPDVDDLVASLRRADGFLVGTGVYWHSWGSPLQRFLEVLTPFENTDVFFRKPVGALVTMDSVGGAELCARLVSVFSQFGCLVPPCTSLVLGRVALEASGRTRAAPPDHDDHDPNDDVWQIEDLDTVLHNLLIAAARAPEPYRPWPFRPLLTPRGAWPAVGRLDLGSPRFLPPIMPVTPG